MTTISIRLEDDDKKELESMLSEMGMNVSTFYMLYTKKVLRERKIPFEIEAPLDPFFSETNIAQLVKSEEQIRKGQTVTKTMEELEELACE